jgi:hypothetical protein
MSNMVKKQNQANRSRFPSRVGLRQNSLLDNFVWCGCAEALLAPVSGNTLYAGGEFTAAGGVAANYIAQAIVGPPILTITVLNSMPDLSWMFIPGSTNLLRATTNSDLSYSQRQVIATNVASSEGLFLYLDQNTAGISAKLYRVSSP